MNDIKQTLTDVWTEVLRMKSEEKDALIVSLNSGNLTKQQYIEGLEDLVTKLKAELQLRVDSGKEFREHLRNCNAEIFRLKNPRNGNS